MTHVPEILGARDHEERGHKVGQDWHVSSIQTMYAFTARNRGTSKNVNKILFRANYQHFVVFA